jgi:hypothetical protein
MQIRPVGAELLHADGQTDMNVTAAFRYFANAPKKDNELKIRNYTKTNRAIRILLVDK